MTARHLDPVPDDDGHQALPSDLAAVARPEACPTCAADPSTAPGRYCARRACRCAHPDCPAFRSYTPLRNPLGDIAVIDHGRENAHTTTTSAPAIWENDNAPGGAGNTIRGLTHSSGTSREGLAMKATRRGTPNGGNTA